MRLFLVQFIKDFRANFINANAYIIFCIYYILSLFSTIYLGDYFLRESDIMNSFFIMQPIILIFTIPAITMRTWAEEIKTGTIEILLTQPIGYLTIVMAKFFASFCFFALLVLSSIFLFIFSNSLSILDIGVVISGYIGLFLCGALFIAVGCTISVFSKNNILSYIATIFMLFFITQLKFGFIGNLSLAPLGFEENFVAFLSGMLSLNNFVYFLVSCILFLWLNVVGVYLRKITSNKDKFNFAYLIIIFYLIFFFVNIGISNCFDKQIDITDEKRLTLSDETKDILKSINKRIDITLYEAKYSRNNANSSYSVYADFVEKILRTIEKQSNGIIRVNITLVEPFSSLERRLINNGVIYEVDNLDYKKYIALEFVDNEGNYNIIKSLNSTRQNLLEADIIRIIKNFGTEKKKIGLFMPNDEKVSYSSFSSLLEEFYDVIHLDTMPYFIDNTFDAFILIKPKYYSTDFLLAIEQYVLNGGSLVLFAEQEDLNLHTSEPIISFLDNFGITVIKEYVDTHNFPFVPSISKFDHTSKDIRSVVVNNPGKLKLIENKNYKVTPILEFENNIISLLSEGFFASNHSQLAKEYESIIPFSKKSGRVVFFNDTDMIHNYIIATKESENNYFYNIIPFTDNMLFILRLMSYITDSKYENMIRYHHYNLNFVSIGNAILNYINTRYELELQKLQNLIDETNKKKNDFYAFLSAKKFASVKNIGDLSKIEQTLEEKTDELNKLKSIIGKDYQNIIMGLTVVLVLVFPLIFVGIMFVILLLLKRLKHKKIRRLTNNVKAS